MFWFKRKKLVVDAYTKYPQLAEMGIPYASRFVPDWWKAIPKCLNKPNKDGMVVPSVTMKTCAGIIDLYKEGNILPLWSDLIIDTNENGGYMWQYADSSLPQIVQHGKDQFATESFDFNQYSHAKLQAPWCISTRKDVKFLAIEPTWNNLFNDYGMKYLPGVVNFKHQHGINVNIFLPNTIRRIKMNCGDPLLHWICLDKNYDVEFRPQVVSPSEFEKHENGNFRQYFINNFRKSSKCPFSGG